MARKLKTCKRKLQKGVDNIKLPQSTNMAGMKFNSMEDVAKHYSTIYPGEAPVQVYRKLADPNQPTEVRTFKDYGNTELDKVQTTGKIMKDKAKNHLKDIVGEPRLANGIDASSITGVDPLTMAAAQAVKAGGQIAGESINLLDQRTDGTTSPLANAAKAYDGGILGPVKAIMAGLGTLKQNKEIQKKEAEAVQASNTARVMSNIQPSQNTQSPIYEDGTYAAGMTQPVEVEKDELVLRKNSLGKYNVVADFKGGKTHNKGGEDYVLKEGDVVFPGKKRKTIMNHIKTNNHSGIESERMRLPKDLPETNELQKGIDGVPKYPTNTGSVFGIEDVFDPLQRKMATDQYNRTVAKDTSARDLIPKYPTTGNVFGITDMMTPEQRAMETLKWRSEGGVSTPKPSNVPSGILPSNIDGQVPNWLQTPTVSGNQTQNSTNGTTPSQPKVEREKVEPLNYTPQVSTTTPVTASAISTPDMRSVEPTIPTPETVQKDSGMSNVLSGIGDYAPAVSNIIRGLQKPETETRRFFTPETQQYKDTSELLRKESDIQSKVDMENAARFSGGSGQVARAGKSLAGSARFKRSQAISTGEAQRAQGIEAQNIAVRNQASANNLQLANQYDAMDSQNKAAIDAYFSQGIHDMGRIGQQRKMDKKAESQQSLMLKMLEDRNFRYDEKGNLVEFKR